MIEPNTVTVNGVPLIEQDDKVVVDYNRHGCFEPETFDWLDNVLSPGTVFFDVGAYTGVYSIFAHDRGCSAVAFEPNRHVYSRLLENVGDRGIECMNVAVSNYSVDAHFTLKARGDMTSVGQISHAGDAVKVISLDSLIYTTGVHAIKVDVEGEEYRVLSGAKELIRMSQPHIIAEFLSDAQKAKIKKLLTGLGYDNFHVKDGRNLVAYSPLTKPHLLP